LNEERIRSEEKGGRVRAEERREAAQGEVEVSVQKSHQKVYVAREDKVAEEVKKPGIELPETIRKKLEEKAE
jgi:hypothetical protein